MAGSLGLLAHGAGEPGLEPGGDLPGRADGVPRSTYGFGDWLCRAVGAAAPGPTAAAALQAFSAGRGTCGGKADDARPGTVGRSTIGSSFRIQVRGERDLSEALCSRQVSVAGQLFLAWSAWAEWSGRSIRWFFHWGRPGDAYVGVAAGDLVCEG